MESVQEVGCNDGYDVGDFGDARLKIGAVLFWVKREAKTAFRAF